MPKIITGSDLTRSSIFAIRAPGSNVRHLELSLLFVLVALPPMVLAMPGASSGEICATCRKITPMPEL